MGYRITLQSTNIVANLTYGKVYCCYRDIFESHENFEKFLNFLDGFEENMFSGRINRYHFIIKNLKNVLLEYKEDYYNDSEKYKNVYHSEILELLKLLSELLSKCKIKALLLPGIEENFMTDFHFLKRIVRMHPDESCLILQPERVYDSIHIFNLFPNFEKALNNIDKWPAIFFWDNNGDYVFIPIESREEVISIFEIVKYERNPIKELRLIASKKIKWEYYIFHLSDLHLNHPKTINGENRLKTLIKKKIENTIDDGEFDVIITGDSIESPKKKNEKKYESFSREIGLSIGKEPIRILGNHDVKTRGICCFRKNNVKLKEYPNIKIIEKSKTILLFFNSNMGGHLAQGCIGKAQMTKMGNMLDNIKNLENYNLIAFLHHHILPIPTPDFFTKKLFGEIIEETLKLKDSKIFFEWLRQRNVKLVLHGHKHIPFYLEKDGMIIMACGSSTGKVDLIDKDKTYISYNVIKINSDCIVCNQYVEDILGAGGKNINLKYIKI